jgi:hypothetical protein
MFRSGGPPAAYTQHQIKMKAMLINTKFNVNKHYINNMYNTVN